MTKKDPFVDRGPDFVDDTPRTRARRVRREIESRQEGADRVFTRGDREFVLSRDKDKQPKVTCKVCGKSEPTSEAAIASFCDAHDHPELRPRAAESAPGDLEQLFADIRELAELKGDGDELEVLSILVRRLKGGLQVYGKLRIDNDERDFEQEALEEAADGMIYSAIAIARRQRKARGRGK